MPFTLNGPCSPKWALHASVFGLKRFFCQIQCFDWAECLPFSHLT